MTPKKPTAMIQNNTKVTAIVQQKRNYMGQRDDTGDTYAPIFPVDTHTQREREDNKQTDNRTGDVRSNKRIIYKISQYTISKNHGFGDMVRGKKGQKRGNRARERAGERGSEQGGENTTIKNSLDKGAQSHSPIAILYKLYSGQLLREEW
jgi:hypothetical protein